MTTYIEPPVTCSDIPFDDGDIITETSRETDVDGVIKITETGHRIIMNPADVVLIQPGDTYVRVTECGVFRDEIVALEANPDDGRDGIHIRVAAEELPIPLRHVQQQLAHGGAYIHGVRTFTKRVSAPTPS